MRLHRPLLVLFALLTLLGSRPLVWGAQSAPASSAAQTLTSGPNGGWGGQFSPDGSRIAFFSSTLHTPSDLWVMNADGSGARRLTTRGAVAAVWLADGQSLQVASKRRGFVEILSVSLAGGLKGRVEGLPPNSSLPVFSPDNKLYAYIVQNEKKGHDLWVSTLDGTHREAVTVDISVRSVFWGKDSAKVYFEAGKSYGVGIWAVDLSTFENMVLLNKYVGTPVYSEAADLIAVPYPDGPGEYSVHTIKTDGSEEKVFEAPRLAGRQLAWDQKGTGVYYLGQDLVAKTPQLEPPKPSGDEKPESLHDQSLKEQQFVRSGVNALWHLDLASGKEVRVSPENLHLTGFKLSRDGKSMLFSGVLPESYATECFRFDLGSQKLQNLNRSRPSWWQPVPNRESDKLAFFTDRERVDALEVADLEQKKLLESYPGIGVTEGTRLFWLPESEGKLISSSRGLLVFDQQGQIKPNQNLELRAYLQADVSIQADQILISAIPKFGEFPGLYQLDVVERALQLKDLRFPSAPEVAAGLYLQPKWSFDGKYVAFSDRQDIWVMNSDGTGRTRITRLTESNLAKQGDPGMASFPVWSPSSKYICYTRLVYADQGVQRQYWIVQRDGSGERMIHSEPLESSFQWHQDESTNRPFFDVTGERLIFTVVRNGLPNLYAASLKGGRTRPLTTSGAIYPALLPEDDMIIFTSLADNQESLWIMNSHGTQKRPLSLEVAETAAAE